MSNNSNEYDALFNLNASELIKDEKKNTISNDIYKPNAKDGKDGIYKSVIRFIPYFKNPNKSIISKWTVWLDNTNTGQKRLVDCPSTVKQKSILQDIFFSLKNSPNAQEQELSKNFARRQNFYSIVQIIKDPNNPELEGQFKILQYGKKIYDKIKNIISPDDDMQESNSPFDLFSGKPFLLHVKTVAQFNNFDDSQFLAKESPIEIDGKVMTKTVENFPIIKKYLEENSPDLSKYDYHDWDDETRQFVLDCIDALIPSGQIKEKILGINLVPKETYKKTTSVNNTPSIKLPENSDYNDVDVITERDELDDILDEPVTKKTTKSSSKKVNIQPKITIDDEDEDPYADL